MTDVYIVTLSILGIMISLPVLLVAINLLFPNVTRRAQSRLIHTPWKSFFLGLPMGIFFLVWIFGNAEANSGILKATAAIAALLGMALGTVGAAGMSRMLGQKVADMTAPASDMVNLLRGAVVYELAAMVPLVGWFVFAPLMGITVFGAGIFAFLKWEPRATRVHAPVQQPVSSESSAPLPVIRIEKQ